MNEAIKIIQRALEAYVYDHKILEREMIDEEEGELVEVDEFSHQYEREGSSETWQVDFLLEGYTIRFVCTILGNGYHEDETCEVIDERGNYLPVPIESIGRNLREYFNYSE